MRLIHFISLSLLGLNRAATLALGKTISPPDVDITNDGLILPDTPDGTFRLTIHSPTHMTLTILSLYLDQTADISISTHQKRDLYLPISNATCTGNDLLANEYTNASAAMGHKCDDGIVIQRRWVLFSRRGNSVAYGCSRGGPNPCSSDEFQSFNEYLDAKCGTWMTGWVYMKAWKKTYGRAVRGERICGKHPDTVGAEWLRDEEALKNRINWP
ncbi:hypothetical protein OQA88_11647 [Cercophora sp. LCS_1]